MSEQILIDTIGKLIAVSCVFFFLINFAMFAMVTCSWDWDWSSIMTIIIVDVLYILLVCIGIMVLVHL